MVAKRKRKPGKVKAKVRAIKEKIYCACKVNPLALGLAFGTIGIIYMLLLSLWANYVGGGGEWVRVISDLYWGYNLSLKGTLIGAGWAFTDCLVIGVIIGVLYNWFAKLSKK